MSILRTYDDFIVVAYTGGPIYTKYVYIVLIIDASSPRDDVPSSLHIRLCDQCICRLVIRVIVEYTILACITS